MWAAEAARTPSWLIPTPLLSPQPRTCETLDHCLPTFVECPLAADVSRTGKHGPVGKQLWFVLWALAAYPSHNPTTPTHWINWYKAPKASPAVITVLERGNLAAGDRSACHIASWHQLIARPESLFTVPLWSTRCLTLFLGPHSRMVP